MRLKLHLHKAALFGLIGLALIFPASASPIASHPFVTGLADSLDRYPDEGALLDRLNRTGVSATELAINWPAIAPRDRPQNWDASDPDDPHYDWVRVDADVRLIARARLQPIAVVASAPSWARLAPQFANSAPRPDDFAAFMKAAATRYDGRHHGLPRIRYWRIWNEPNLSLFFQPQVDPGTRKFTSPDVYRAMVNQAAVGIHLAAKGNLVIAGGTGPFSDIAPEVVAVDRNWGPLKFMQRLLCIDRRGRSTCASRVSFDVWSTHPYTSGGPLHHAQRPYDISLGDLPKMRASLRAAIRAHHITSTGRVRFWVTEFAWDSNKPDPCAAPLGLLKRWVPEALYRMWANGIESVSWFKLMDEPLGVSFFQSGLFFGAPSIAVARPKPFLEGFRFPFVALRRSGHVYIWARTPRGRPALLIIQRSFAGGWVAVRRVRSDRYGIAQALLSTPSVGSFRAVLAGGEASVPFSMAVPKDRPFPPFGSSVLTPQGPEKC